MITALINNRAVNLRGLLDNRAVNLIDLEHSAQYPDGPFHNFRTSNSGDRPILCSSGTSYDGF